MSEECLVTEPVPHTLHSLHPSRIKHTSLISSLAGYLAAQPVLELGHWIAEWLSTSVGKMQHGRQFARSWVGIPPWVTVIFSLFLFHICCSPQLVGANEPFWACPTHAGPCRIPKLCLPHMPVYFNNSRNFLITPLVFLPWQPTTLLSICLLQLQLYLCLLPTSLRILNIQYIKLTFYFTSPTIPLTPCYKNPDFVGVVLWQL